MSLMLNLRTLRNLTQKLEPHRKNHSDTPLTTFTQIKVCYEGTSKLLQSLDLESQ